MSERISAVIHYDGEVCHTENGVVFLSENTVRLVFNQNIDLTELRERIRLKIFGTTPMKVLSITYRFCSSVDPVTYDSFDIRGARSLEAMVQTHLTSGAPYIELYVQFTSLNDAVATGVREEYATPARLSVSGLQNTKQPMFGSGVEYTTLARHSVGGWDMHVGGSMFDAGNTYWGTASTFTSWQSTSNWGHYEMPKRRDNVLPTMSTGEETLYVTDDGDLEYDSNVDPPREPMTDGDEVGLFSESEPIPTEPEDVEGGSDEEEDPRFRAYSPSCHMHNVDLSADDALEFPNLPHRLHDHTSSVLDSVQDGTCSWKIYASLRKMTGLWEIKKYKGPHTCAAGISQYRPKMDSAMLASLILPTLKVDPRTSVLVLIANIRNQMGYTPSYRKAWIAKQKALEKIHSGWDASYNHTDDRYVFWHAR
ncbi:uncharacterized protein LOC128032742 [Gossypium raimondii]|uniref:uncharacterized protein LOC128032742 n=1 Tax=Gossypium raimondii TaxID=29730 RepID=UPI00227C37CC|nr:uncharacterized protein LOC128032742 [Gossypium raimondii]